MRVDVRDTTETMAVSVTQMQTTLQQVRQRLTAQLGGAQRYPEVRKHTEQLEAALNSGDLRKVNELLNAAQYEVSKEASSPVVRKLNDRLERVVATLGLLTVAQGDEIEMSQAKVEYLLNGDVDVDEGAEA